MISCKISFKLMVTVFKESPNLLLPLIFYNSITFVFETVQIETIDFKIDFRTNRREQIWSLVRD